MATLIIISIRGLFTLIYLLIYLGIGWSLYALLAKWFTWKNTNLLTNLISIFHKLSLKRLSTSEATAALIITFVIITFTVHSIKIWRTDIEPTLTFNAIGKEFVPDIFLNLFSTVNTLVAKPKLDIQMELINEHLIDLQSDKKKWTKESLEGKDQYIIGISNESGSDIVNLTLDFQFPFFVSYQEIIEERNVSGRTIKANFTNWSASPTLSVEKIGKPIPMSFTIRARSMSPKGFLKVLFVIEKAELVKETPPPESEMSKTEFIHGTFEYKKKNFEIYYPFKILQDRSLFLGPPESKMPTNAIYIYTLGPSGNARIAEEYINSGDTHYNNREYEEALKDHNKAIQLNPQNARSYNSRGILFLEIRKDYDKAIADFSEAINRRPEEAGYYINRAIAYYRKGIYAKAISDYSHLIKIDPRQATIYNERGNAYAAAGNRDLAILDYNKAIELDNNLVAAYNNRGVEYAKMERYDLAIEDFNKAIKINPDHVDAKRNLKRALMMKDQKK